MDGTDQSPEQPQQQDLKPHIIQPIGEMGEVVDAIKLHETMQGLGWLLKKPVENINQGGEELLIALRRTPTNKHFDPLRVETKIVSTKHPDVTKITLTPTSPVLQTSRYALGPINAVDRDRKTESFFSWGGNITCIPDPHSEGTIAKLDSTVPILHFDRNGQTDPTVVKVLSDGVQAELATLRPRLRNLLIQRNKGILITDSMIDALISRFKPLDLFITGINSLLNSHSIRDRYHVPTSEWGQVKRLRDIYSEKLTDKSLKNATLEAILL